MQENMELSEIGQEARLFMRATDQGFQRLRRPPIIDHLGGDG
jgi:hypothetical protein